MRENGAGVAEKLSQSDARTAGVLGGQEEVAAYVVIRQDGFMEKVS